MVRLNISLLKSYLVRLVSHPHLTAIPIYLWAKSQHVFSGNLHALSIFFRQYTRRTSTYDHPQLSVTVTVIKYYTGSNNM